MQRTFLIEGSAVEEAIHILTGKNADHFGLTDRGTIKVGKQADIVVFAIDEIERRKDKLSMTCPTARAACSPSLANISGLSKRNWRRRRNNLGRLPRYGPGSAVIRRRNAMA
jgi:N-acyl-D-aspartate/D-glutamate deacylase